MRAARSGCVAVVLLALLLVVSGCGRKAAPDPPPDDTTEYVALGDSFTAVAGTGPYTDALCNRGADDYPSLLAKKLGITSFADVSCGGAKTVDLTQAQLIEPNKGVNQPQFSALTPGTKLITLGIGLNDNDLAFFLTTACLPKRDELKTYCAAYVNQPDSVVTDRVDQMGDLVANSLDLIRQRAPEARIVLVGYPRLAPDQGTCTKQLPFPGIVVDRLRSTLRDANTTLAAVAKRKKVDYVDMYAPSRGHDICSDSPWVNGVKEVKDKALPFHPYKAYHRAVADKIAALIAKG